MFEELRREVEGEVYGTIEKKMAAVEGELAAMAASPERVQRLTGWSWIRETLAQLPPRIYSLVIENWYKIDVILGCIRQPGFY